MNEETTTPNRRDFLKSAAALAGITVAPGILLYSVSQAKPADQAVTSEQRWGMLIDVTQCTSGCKIGRAHV